MLPVSTLLNQLTTMQQLAVESDLQSKVAYNSSTLSVFSSMLFGETKKEILASCALDNNNYPKKERPIYQALLDFYGLTAETSRDQFMAEVHFAIHEETYADKNEKVKRLEELFHQMKRHNLEQESTNLLFELTNITVGSPLHAVYEHLYHKYSAMEINNNLAFTAFENLNVKISDYLTQNLKEHNTKDLISVYKEIRTLHSKNENKISSCLLNTSMFLLASYCNQTQLLKENRWSMTDLFETCKNEINLLPFGVEKMFLENIFNKTLKNAIQKNSLEITTSVFQRLKKEENKITAYDFGLVIQEDETDNQNNKREYLIKNFVRRMTTTTISLKQNSIIASPHRI